MLNRALYSYPVIRISTVGLFCSPLPDLEELGSPSAWRELLLGEPEFSSRRQLMSCAVCTFSFYLQLFYPLPKDTETVAISRQNVMSLG